jgi:hypothetical protein
MGLGITYAVSSPIRQSFALDASRSDFSAFKVIHAKDRTRRSLRPCWCDMAAHVFVNRVIDGFVAGEVLA